MAVYWRLARCRRGRIGERTAVGVSDSTLRSATAFPLALCLGDGILVRLGIAIVRGKMCDASSLFVSKQSYAQPCTLGRHDRLRAFRGGVRARRLSSPELQLAWHSGERAFARPLRLDSNCQFHRGGVLVPRICPGGRRGDSRGKVLEARPSVSYDPRRLYP